MGKTPRQAAAAAFVAMSMFAGCQSSAPTIGTPGASASPNWGSPASARTNQSATGGTGAANQTAANGMATASGMNNGMLTTNGANTRPQTGVTYGNNGNFQNNFANSAQPSSGFNQNQGAGSGQPSSGFNQNSNAGNVQPASFNSNQNNSGVQQTGWATNPASSGFSPNRNLSRNTDGGQYSGSGPKLPRLLPYSRRRAITQAARMSTILRRLPSRVTRVTARSIRPCRSPVPAPAISSVYES